MTNKDRTLESSFLSTISNDNLKDVCKESTEVLIDSFLNDGLVKDIPIVNIVYGLAKAGINVKERLFIEKVIRFLKPISKYTSQERQKFLSDLDPEELKKASQYLVLYLDRLDSLEKPEMLGKVFEAYMRGRINYNKMLYFTHFIDSVFILVLAEYHAAIKRYHDAPVVNLRIDTDDALALEKVGFYKEVSDVSRKLASTGKTVSIKEIKRRLVLTDMGWEFIKIVFQLWTGEENEKMRSRLMVHLH